MSDGLTSYRAGRHGADADAAFTALSRVRAATARPKGRGRADGALALVLFAMVAIVVLVAMLMAANSYAVLANERVASADLRAESNLLVNTVRASDCADAVYVGTGPEGPALVLVERLESGEYETRIYAYRGAVVQEYAVAGASYAPDAALRIAESDTFAFDYDGGLLTIVTDSGATSVALRSAQGGAA